MGRAYEMSMDVSEQEVADQSSDELPNHRDTHGATGADVQQARQSPIEQLRSYLEQAHLEPEVLDPDRPSWRERFSSLLYIQVAIVALICTIAISIAVGIVWMGNPRGLASGGVPLTPLPPDGVAATRPAGVSSPTVLRPTIPASTRAPEPSVANPASPEPLLATDPFPTASPLGAATGPGGGPTSAAALLLRAAEAEAGLRKGQLKATISYGGRPRSTAVVRFDLGDGEHVPSFQIISSYEGGDHNQTTERITVGDYAWDRQQSGQWIRSPARESALKQLQAFLPRTDSIAELDGVAVDQAVGEQSYQLQWYDSARDADVTLIVDTAGMPQQLRRVARANGLILTVDYERWNQAVQISPPE